ncbi:MAG: peptidase dimerization domain-containing protein [Candidatus Rokuibacteriota bacterium]
MSKVVQRLESLTLRGEPDPDLPGLPRLQVGSIIGRRGREWELRGPNIVPDFCSVFVDVRFPQSLTPDSILGDIRRAIDDLARTDADLSYEIEFPMKPERRAMREVMAPLSVSPDQPVVRMLKANVTAILGEEPRVGAVAPQSYAGNDTSRLYAAGIPCCLYGPAGGFSETSADRWTSVEQVMTCTRVFGAMIADVCA